MAAFDPEMSCEAYNDDPTRVRRVAREMPPTEAIEIAGVLLKAVADPVRIRILYALSKESLCVCELATLLSMSMPAVSHHLKTLSLSGVISARKEGKFVCYAIRADHAGGVLGALLQQLDRAKAEAA